MTGIGLLLLWKFRIFNFDNVLDVEELFLTTQQFMYLQILATQLWMSKHGRCESLSREKFLIENVTPSKGTRLSNIL